VFALLVAVASAIPEEGYNYQAPGGQGSQFPTGAGGAQYPSVPAQYAFQWDVNHEPSGNFYGHKEQREDANTEYSTVFLYFYSYKTVIIRSFILILR